MEQKYIANWTSFSVHIAGVLIMCFLSFYKKQRMQKRFIVLAGASFMISALYEMALARGQGVFLRTDLVVTQWARWTGSLFSELIIAYLVGYLIHLKKNALLAFLYCVAVMIASFMIITISTGDNIWIWFGVAVGHFAFASKILIFDYVDNYPIVRFGLPIVYALYGLFFLLGPSVNQNINQAGENFAYMGLDVVTKIAFWIYVATYVSIREKRVTKIGPNSLGYVHLEDAHHNSRDLFD